MDFYRECAFPKPTRRIIEKSRRRIAAAEALAKCYRLVDARDKGHCRVCRRACSPTSIGLEDRAERHHIVYRSRGGEHDSSNVVTLCKRTCHYAIHSLGELRVSGDADLRDERGKLCGVKVERLTESGWTVDKFV